MVLTFGRPTQEAELGFSEPSVFQLELAHGLYDHHFPALLVELVTESDRDHYETRDGVCHC